MTALLTVQGLHAGYSAIRALRGCSLEVAKGETVAVVGANGAGKTTLMRAISGMIRATAGHVTFDGTPIDGWPPHRLVGWGLLHVPEGRGTILGLTVGDNLRLAHAGGTTREPFDAAVARVYARFPRLCERQMQRAGNLSGGEQQMLALSRAIVAPPRLLLVDEPSLGLSPLATSEVFAALAEFKASGMGMLIVEQNVRRTLRIADRAHVLRQGVFVASGTGAELLTDPALLTGYLGATPSQQETA